MNLATLCLGTNRDFGIPAAEQIRLFKKVGFEAFFSDSGEGDSVAECRKVAEEEGMIYQSVHAPFGQAAAMWKPQKEAAGAIDELLRCLDDCAQNAVPMMIVHAFIGFEDHSPTEDGVKNFEIVVKAAEKAGVKIAFENTEGEEYLERLMTSFRGYENVGFCWDTGHEMCYNHSQDLLAKYGDRLFGTHLNDNLGIRDRQGNITWRDDLHLLPFDGVADWQDIVRRLNRHQFQGILTFELNNKSKPDRHDNDKYAKLPIEEYVTEAYARACKVATLKHQIKEW